MPGDGAFLARICTHMPAFEGDDRVDAEILARMGQALDLAPTPPEESVRARPADLVARRDGARLPHSKGDATFNP